MDVDLYINDVLRTDLTVRRLLYSYVQPWSAELGYEGRHDAAGGHICNLWDVVRIEQTATGRVLFRGDIVDISPGGVADEGVTYVAKGRRFRLENEPVNINGSGFYIWNRRGYRCNYESGEDSPGQDGGKWTAGEIILDILEHAFGIPSGGSDIPGHHGDDCCITDTYLTSEDITGWVASEWLALDSVMGEFSVDNTPVAEAIEMLVRLNGGFYGWYIDPEGVLRLHNLKELPETSIEAGVLGTWQDAGGTDYTLLDNKLDWSLDGVYSDVMVQGTDLTVEVKPANIEGCGNAALNGGGELELVNQPWMEWECAYRNLCQPYRLPTARPIGWNGSCEDREDECECGEPAAAPVPSRGPRVYRGTDAGAKTLCLRDGLYLNNNWRWNLGTGILMFYWDVEGDLDPGEKLWGWYWARRPFTARAGPEGTAYQCLGYRRTLKVYDPAFKHPSAFPVPGYLGDDDEAAMGDLAANLLEQVRDIRVQGTLAQDEVDIDHDLRTRYSVLRLGHPGTTTTTLACWPSPMDWRHLQLNAVEVNYDFVENRTEITAANTLYMHEDYSELKRRMEENLFRRREYDLSEDILECATRRSDFDCREGTTEGPGPTTPAPPSTTTAAPGASTTTLPAATSTTGAPVCDSCQEIQSWCFRIKFHCLCGRIPDGYSGYQADLTWGYLVPDPDGDMCVWSGLLYYAGGMTTTTCAPTPQLGGRIYLVFHPTLGWLVLHQWMSKWRVWRKRRPSGQPLDPCAPEAMYDCAGPPVGTAHVIHVPCPSETSTPAPTTTPAPTSSTGAPTSTTSTTTGAPKPTTTTLPPGPLDCCCTSACLPAGEAQNFCDDWASADPLCTHISNCYFTDTAVPCTNQGHGGCDWVNFGPDTVHDYSYDECSI